VSPFAVYDGMEASLRAARTADGVISALQQLTNLVSTSQGM
jgi:hypothetical protein